MTLADTISWLFSYVISLRMSFIKLDYNRLKRLTNKEEFERTFQQLLFVFVLESGRFALPHKRNSRSMILSDYSNEKVNQFFSFWIG